MKNLHLIIVTILVLSISSLPAQQKSEKKDSVQTEIPKPVQVTTHHSITINGQQINYTAATGTFLLKDENDSAIALIGFTAYTKEGVTDPASRPITFAYNGGPGSSSIWLHMGALGPKRVVLDDPNVVPPAPYKMEDNKYSIIDATDLVMIDPVGTGFARPVGKAKGKDFWGVNEDIKSVSEFIFQYIRADARWNSPKFLLGESYGTTRSAGVADYLFENEGITVNGIILVSTVLNFEDLEFAYGNDLPYILFLPTYAAVAWYHNALPSKPADLAAFLDEVRNFAKDQYANALFKGASMDTMAFDSVAGKLREYTGLSQSYWEKANLRVKESQFTEELLREKGEVVGRLDSRYKAPNEDLLGEYSEFDPQDIAIAPAFTSVFLNYLHTELNFPTDETYHTDAYTNKDFKWNWSRSKEGVEREPRYPDVSPDLADIMSKDPYLKVMVFNGYFDLATPFFQTEYTMDHLGNNIPDIKDRIEMEYFNAGHMMYVHPESLPQFKKYAAEFIKEMTERAIKK